MELHTLLWSVVSSLSVHTLLAVPLISRASVVQVIICCIYYMANKSDDVLIQYVHILVT